MLKIILNAFCLMIALISGISLFVLKYHVKAEEEKLQSIHREILQNKRERHMLEAEWAYLNDPQRLLALVHLQTDWQPIAPEQIVALSDIPMRETEEIKEAEIINTAEKAEAQKPARALQKEFVPVAPKPAVAKKANNASASKSSANNDEKHQGITQKQSLDSLAQNAKALSSGNAERAGKKSRSQLSGTTQKDFVWSPKKKSNTSSYSKQQGRRF